MTQGIINIYDFIQKSKIFVYKIKDFIYIFIFTFDFIYVKLIMNCHVNMFYKNLTYRRCKQMKKYGVAVIGCGQMGIAHLEHIYYKDNVNLLYVCDVDIEKAALSQKKYNAKYAETDVLKCISDNDVEVVICATYPSSHLEILKMCIEYGKHLICEKPITSNLEDGIEFKKLVDEHPECKVLIGHILRHNNTYNEVARMIRNGAIGNPIIIRMAQNHHTMNWERYLELIKETSPIIDCGVHYVDVMQWFTGEKITNISGVGLKTEADVPKDKYNYGIITVQLSGGSVGYYEAGWSNTMSSDNLKEFIGPKGRIKIIYSKDRQTHQEEGDLIEYYRYPEKNYEIINIESDRKPTDVQFDHLVDMIENNAEATPTMEEAFESFKIVVEADRLIREKNRK